MNHANRSGMPKGRGAVENAALQVIVQVEEELRVLEVHFGSVHYSCYQDPYRDTGSGGSLRSVAVLMIFCDL